MTITLSLIIPAFNEGQRLPGYLSTVRAYLSEVHPFKHQVIVVDDGSVDGTREIVQRLAKNWPEPSLLSHSQNVGKGAAVRTGMLDAGGELLLFTDADGATPIGE